MIPPKSDKTPLLQNKEKVLKTPNIGRESQEYSVSGVLGMPQADLHFKRLKITLSAADRKLKNKSFEVFMITKAWLEKTFPNTFNFKVPKPLKEGIQCDLLNFPSPLSKRQLRRGIGSYVNSKAYLKAIVNQKWRYDLNGKQVEEVLEGHKTYARKRLAEKKGKWERKNKAKPHKTRLHTDF